MNSPVVPLPLAARLAPSLDAALIKVLNSECFCVSLDADALRLALQSEIGQPDLFELIRERCPYLFAARPVFVSQAHTARMARLVQAIEAVVALPAYREEVLAQSPAIARHEPGGAKGVFFGYDFHVTEGGFGLIEINTIPGGTSPRCVVPAHRPGPASAPSPRSPGSRHVAPAPARR